MSVEAAQAIIAGTPAQLVAILASPATPTGGGEGIARQAPGSKPPCNLDRIDRIESELYQVRWWHRRWLPHAMAFTVRHKLEDLHETASTMPTVELDRLLAHWGAERRINARRWPTGPIAAPVERLTLTEAANRVGKSERTVQRWLEKHPSAWDREARVIYADQLVAIAESTRLGRPANVS